jgi:hypothetical protein
MVHPSCAPLSVSGVVMGWTAALCRFSAHGRQQEARLSRSMHTASQSWHFAM